MYKSVNIQINQQKLFKSNGKLWRKHNITEHFKSKQQKSFIS